MYITTDGLLLVLKPVSFHRPEGDPRIALAPPWGSFVIIARLAYITLPAVVSENTVDFLLLSMRGVNFSSLFSFHSVSVYGVVANTATR